MAKPNPDDRDRRRRLIEESQEARRQMQEILDRVEARMQERQARRERSLLRRLFAR
ncbi:MAG: hypothetical protein ACRDPZ_14200 [Gaiellaceae bacterium]|jgi:DNA-binding MarR family transcriptional regulator